MKLNEVISEKAGNLKSVQNYESGHLDLAACDLTSLEGCPQKVTGNFNCYMNNLTSLEGCPKEIIGHFDCSENRLTSFEYFPKYIGQSCLITKNKFTSFKDIDKHIQHIGGKLYCNITDYENHKNLIITSGYSDLFGINGLLAIDIVYPIVSKTISIEDIINKWLPTKDLINFQDEMIKAGFESLL